MIEIVDDITPLSPRLRKHDRHCPKCGTVVCSYKDPHLRKVWCYKHDHLQPWTYRNIVGIERVWDKERAVETRTGKGRGWHGPHVLRKDRV
jgi:hypothetical protein